MNAALYYLAASGMLCVLLWTPYILNRVFVWGIPSFASNYPSRKFPAEAPAIPVWAERAQRAHLNMVETLPAFAAVVLAAYLTDANSSVVNSWAAIFFWARIFHATVYRAHLRSFGFYEKMLGSVYSKCHGLFKQSDRFRMGNHRASVVGGVASEEEDSSPGLELSRPDGRHLLSPQEWMQLGGLAQRFAPLLNGLLALQTVAGRRDA